MICLIFTCVVILRRFQDINPLQINYAAVEHEGAYAPDEIRNSMFLLMNKSLMPKTSLIFYIFSLIARISTDRYSYKKSYLFFRG